MPFPTCKTTLAAAAAFGLLAACGGGGGIIHSESNDTEALKEAIESNDTEAITRLVKAGRDADGVWDGGYGTPLHYAADRGQSDALSALLKADPDANVDVRWERHDIGKTPMHYAFYRGIRFSEGGREVAQIPVIRVLLEAGADPNVASSTWPSSLHMHPLWEAASVGNATTAIAILLGAGADPNAELGFADPYGAEQVAESLEPGEFSFEGLTAISNAANAAVVAALLAAGSKPTAKDLFYLASSNMDSAALARTLEAGRADLSVKDEEGFTPLHMAARDGNAAALAVLLEAGADPDERRGDRRQHSLAHGSV